MLTDSVVTVRLILSVILGGLIGLERQMQRRAAGLRTHILVSLGSCLIMLTSQYVFVIYKDVTAIDPARIAAGIITGIGFLGAGAIIREKEEIKGLTTAASLWVVSGIGLAVGVGFYNASFITTILTLICLFILRKAEKRLLNKPNSKEEEYGPS
ncbi:MAG: MgtC/SapB family protein [Candidatus Omnitrophica bacterium]|nr:MgtC/SapB family protein [Candidatus Omnitrophota bacterium]